MVLRGLAKQGIAPAVYVNSAVRLASKEIRALEGACDLRALANGDALSLAGMSVHAFATCTMRLRRAGFVSKARTATRWGS